VYDRIENEFLNSLIFLGFPDENEKFSMINIKYVNFNI